MLLMVQGHTIDAVLADGYRSSDSFLWWTAARGLTACLFLVASGFAFALSTFRAGDRARPTRRLGRRVVVLLVLAYALHFPSASVWELSSLAVERWRGFLIVDVLQCIAMTLLLLQLLARVARTPLRFAVTGMAGCGAIVALTPWVWSIEWSAHWPTAVAAYLSPEVGSPFPLFPWTAYSLLGAAIGTVYLLSSAAPSMLNASRLLVTLGAIFIAASFMAPMADARPLGAGNLWSTSPASFLLHGGLVCLVLGAIASVSPFLTGWRWLIEPLARHSLLIYAVHLCIVYGSVWNAGLYQIQGHTLSLSAALAWVGGLWVFSACLAIAWAASVYRAPVAANIARAAAGGFLLGRLL